MDQEHELFLQAAEQLQELKAELEQQQGASSRLRELVAVVGGLADTISKLPQELGNVVLKAEQAEQRLLTAVSEVEGLRRSVPEIIQRIENSDYGQSIASLLAEVSKAREELAGIRESASSIREAAEAVRASSTSLASEVNAGLLRVSESQVNVLQGLQNLGSKIDAKFGDLSSKVEQIFTKQAADSSAAVAGFSHISGALRGVAERQALVAQEYKASISGLKSTDLGALKSLLTDVNSKLDAQGRLIEGLNKKKGFFGR